MWKAGELARLCGYTYAGVETVMPDLQREFIAKAMRADLLHSAHTFYDFLYAFHTARHECKQGTVGIAFAVHGRAYLCSPMMGCRLMLSVSCSCAVDGSL